MESKVPGWAKGGGILFLFVIVLVGVCGGYLWEIVPANEIVVIQHVSGQLKAVTEPGPTWQGFGSVTHYHKRAQYAFNKGCRKEDIHAHIPKQVRFYDGGHADICGAISWEMPLDHAKILSLHQIYNSQDAIETQLIDKAIDNAAYTSGPTMSSTESSGEKRTELLQIIDDQTRNGVFETKVVQKTIKDPTTGKDVTANIVQVVIDEKSGTPKRRMGSMAAEVGIRFEPLTIAEIRYDKVVEEQIAKRQEAITAVQTSVANSTRAEQDARTAEQQGRAEAAKAKWAQETINAKDIALAEKEKTVSKLAADAAEQTKRKLILEGEGEAAKKRLVMEANGALDVKLEAWTTVNTAYATAIQNYAGNWVPQIVMGQSGQTNSANNMVDMLMIKTAKELGLDMTTLPSKRSTPVQVTPSQGANPAAK
jgi:regulator of protease activity HflC (stomatin/prohibitin superfamily)